jgi:uncharacterized protein (TIGR03067 family)
MITRHLPAFLACVLLAGCSSSSARNGGADQDGIQGTWRTERVEIGGKVSDDETFRNLTLTFSGDNAFTEVGGVRHEGTFTLDAFRVPRHIDLKPAAGNTTDKAMQGVYSFEGPNSLRVCFGQKSRPGGFHTGPTSDAITFELRRTPPREPAEKNRMTAADLADQCKKNRAVTTDAYRNSVLQVTGKVSVNKDGHVFLAATGPDYIECVFSRNYKSELERVARLKDQQTVVLRGTFNGSFDGQRLPAGITVFVQLLNCEVVEVLPDEDRP